MWRPVNSTHTEITWSGKSTVFSSDTTWVCNVSVSPMHSVANGPQSALIVIGSVIVCPPATLPTHRLRLDSPFRLIISFLLLCRLTVIHTLWAVEYPELVSIASSWRQVNPQFAGSPVWMEKSTGSAALGFTADISLIVVIGVWGIVFGIVVVRPAGNPVSGCVKFFITGDWPVPCSGGGHIITGTAMTAMRNSIMIIPAIIKVFFCISPDPDFSCPSSGCFDPSSVNLFSSTRE